MEERTNNPAARLYRSMYLIRRVEEEIIRLYPSDKIKRPVHLSIGQEAVSAAVCDPLEPRDYVSAPIVVMPSTWPRAATSRA
jgi:TPP-dependent pyruvate/acetoin dehydrogenase alpha subunit